MFITQENFHITSMLIIMYPTSIYLVHLLSVFVCGFPMETEMSDKHRLHFKLCLRQRNTLNVAALETWKAVGTVEVYHEKRHCYKVSLVVYKKTIESNHISEKMVEVAKAIPRLSCAVFLDQPRETQFSQQLYSMTALPFILYLSIRWVMGVTCRCLQSGSDWLK